ncbi:hypothetical protein CCU68_25235 [Pseudomonas gingeri NCPPB 3146 = LMG 5327]|uniref:Uncharacterized protein n=1 Tax=Pseudomonas gingeri NCPPB 3146 = LMG 5327 TaxID=707248 RepID=A0ABX4XXC8_9PSED|nr:hypothetical protein CCU68_25235 [Pseudomonas gingeri NCPPB 3146 = LMG 5327]
MYLFPMEAPTATPKASHPATKSKNHRPRQKRLPNKQPWRRLQRKKSFESKKQRTQPMNYFFDLAMNLSKMMGIL